MHFIWIIFSLNNGYFCIESEIINKIKNNICDIKVNADNNLLAFPNPYSLNNSQNIKFYFKCKKRLNDCVLNVIDPLNNVVYSKKICTKQTDQGGNLSI